jgi:predicted NBD/HSP70 family sugar kinase
MDIVDLMRHGATGALSGATGDVLRRRNLGAILRRVHLGGPASRSELAEETGLNRSTVGDLVGDLARRGLVHERRARPSGVPGRPSPIVEIEPERLVVLAIEIFPDELGAALVGLGGVILERSRRSRVRRTRPPDEDIATLAELCSPLLSSAAADGLHAVSVAVAGVVRQDGLIVVAPNLDWRDTAIAAPLRAALEVDVPVLVANDADLATLAELTRGAGVGSLDFVGLWGEVGVGAGIVVNGSLIRGRAGFAGEVGHMPVRPGGRPCHCGSRGCWETEVGEDAVLRAVGIEGDGGPQVVDGIIAAAEAGDPRTLDGLQSIGRWLGIGLVGLANTLDPDRIALGGMFGRFHPYVRESIASELARRRWMAAGHVEIVAARLREDAPFLGAAEAALESVLEDPTTIQVARPGGSAQARRTSRKEVGATDLIA